MLRTNSKKAKENLMQYIRESVEDYMIDCFTWDEEETGIKAEYSTESNEDICRFIYSRFVDETRGDRRNMPQQARFIEWSQGLPCGGLFNYYCCKAVPILGDILEETEEERNRFTEQQAEEMLSKLIYREVWNRIPY